MSCIIDRTRFNKCNGCDHILPLSDFYRFKVRHISTVGKSDTYYNYPRTPCKKCILKQSREWVKNNRVRSITKVRLWSYRKKIELLKIMGGKCICCGNTEWWNLTLDHLIPIRRKNHERTGITTLLLKNPQMMKDFQILCYGCNNSKNSYEKCRLDHTLKI